MIEIWSTESMGLIYGKLHQRKAGGCWLQVTGWVIIETLIYVYQHPAILLIINHMKC